MLSPRAKPRAAGLAGPAQPTLRAGAEAANSLRALSLLCLGACLCRILPLIGVPGSLFSMHKYSVGPADVR